MARGRPPKSAEIHRLQGTYRKDRHGNRREFTEDELPAIGEPPNHLTDQQRAIWRELVSQSVPGVLRVSDRIMLEIAVCLLDQFRSDPDFKAAQISVLTRCLGSLGFSMAERARMKISTPKKSSENPFDEF